MSSLPEAFCAMDLISEVSISAQFHDILVKEMLKPLKRFGELDFPGAKLNATAFKAWKQWYERPNKLPQIVKQYCDEFLQRVPVGHISAKPARELLEV